MKKYLQHPNIHTYDASDSPLFPVFNEYGQPLLIEPGQPLPRYYLLTRKIFFFLIHVYFFTTFIFANNIYDITWARTYNTLLHNIHKY